MKCLADIQMHGSVKLMPTPRSSQSIEDEKAVKLDNDGSGNLMIKSKVVDFGGAEITNFVIDTDALGINQKPLCKIYIENLVINTK